MKRIATMLMLLVLAAGLGGCGSPRYEFKQTKGPLNVALSIDPYPEQSLAPNTYTVQVTKNGQEVEAPVKMDFQMADMDMGNNLVQAEPKGKGIYVVRKMLAMSGKWEVTVEVQGEKFVFNTIAQGQKVSNAN